uniref:Reverse transcriptase domain-containing protein n=1 Tax=Tanacetum cinerariifolium TaxID=118510 RepID=A0A6L2M6F0_TANCI|nr:hypothetical protein [Tanacetum cinerariifolium]
MAQNINFSGSDQIQTPQYPDVHLPCQEISKEVCQAKEDLFKSIQTFLETFICIPFEEKPKILFQVWEIFFAIQYSKPENPNKLFQKLLGDLKELAEYENSPNASEEQKQNLEDTILELVKICQEKEFHCIHDNVDDLIESDLNTKLLLINSQRLDKKEQEVKKVVEQPAERGNRSITIGSLQNFKVIHKSSISLKNKSQISLIHAVAPILSTKKSEYSPSMGLAEESGVEEENVVQQEEEEEDNPSIPRPPLEPPDAEFEPDYEKEIPVVMNEKDESYDDYFLFMFVIQIFLPYRICSKMFISFLSAESEDTIFDPGFTPQ